MGAFALTSLASYARHSNGLDIQGIILTTIQELDRLRTLHMAQYDVPTEEATRLALRLGLRWTEFEDVVSRMMATGLVLSQGAAGGRYISLSELGRKLAE